MKGINKRLSKMLLGCVHLEHFDKQAAIFTAPKTSSQSAQKRSAGHPHLVPSALGSFGRSQVL